jgi:folate-binding protein YgfZ
MVRVGQAESVSRLSLHDFHQRLGAQFTTVNGVEVVDHYGDPLAEHAALRQAAGVLDLSFRGRLCLLGADRQKFLNGQVTNDVKSLKTGEGCYAALVNAKGKLQSDLNLYCLADELLLDFEPGLTQTVAARLERYIIADDVQMVEVAPHYGLLSVQGPKAAGVLANLGLAVSAPSQPMTFVSVADPARGTTYLMNQPRTGSEGFDLYVPTAALDAMAQQLSGAVGSVGGKWCGWQALEIARVEVGIPRFGADMDESNLPPEAGLDERAISYTKGCYIGQEVIARLRTYGQVAKALRGLRLADDLPALPAKGDKLFKDGKEVGFITSAVRSPALRTTIALGYVRREVNQIGARLIVRTTDGESSAEIVELPFR